VSSIREAQGDRVVVAGACGPRSPGRATLSPVIRTLVGEKARMLTVGEPGQFLLDS